MKIMMWGEYHIPVFLAIHLDVSSQGSHTAAIHEGQATIPQDLMLFGLSRPESTQRASGNEWEDMSAS